MRRPRGHDSRFPTFLLAAVALSVACSGGSQTAKDETSSTAPAVTSSNPAHSSPRNPVTQPGAPAVPPQNRTVQPASVDSVLLVTIDTLRADHLSCYGRSPVQTPNLDALAARGARVARAWTTVPLTTASHAAIMTGLYPATIGIRDNGGSRLPAGASTLAVRMRIAGKKTGAFVASYTTSRDFGFDQGFETFDDDFGHARDGSERRQRPANDVVARASSWLSQVGAQPFFLWVHLFDPHTPYEPPEPYRGAHPRDPYSGEIAFADAQLGLLFEALRNAGLDGRTIVAALSDHGEGLREHGEPDHGYLLYESTLAIPFLIAAPGKIAPGTVISGPASTVDLVPTLYDLLGMPAAQELQGRSLVAGGGLSDRPVFAETLYPQLEFGWSALYALRRGDLKVIDAPQREMYDLAADPRERSDLAGARAPDLAKLSSAMREMKARLASDASRSAPGTAEQPLDAEAIAKLESLGYAAGGGGSRPSRSTPFPEPSGRGPRETITELVPFERAQLLLLDGKPAEAAVSLKKLAADDPANPQIALKLAGALAASGARAEADAAYAAVIRAHPEFYLAYRSYAGFLLGTKRAGDAVGLWRRAPASFASYAGFAVVVAQAETAAGDPARAAARLEAYLATHADDVEGWAELGMARIALKDVSSALEAFQRGLALRPSHPIAAGGAVAILEKSGRHEEAVQLVRELLARAPGDPILLKLSERIRAPAL